MSESIDPKGDSQLRWYVATVIFRCIIDGREGNPFSGSGKQSSQDRPAVYRMLYLLKNINAEVAPQHAIDLGRTKAKSMYTTAGVWEFAGLEDLQEFSGDLRDGMLLWSRCSHGLSAAQFVRPKEELSAFFPDVNGWCSFPPEQYWPELNDKTLHDA